MKKNEENKKEIDKKTVLDLMNICIENNIYYMVFTDKEIVYITSSKISFSVKL